MANLTGLLVGTVLALALCAGIASATEQGAADARRTDWFRDAKWGVFTHYLGSADLSAEEWNRRVDGFDAEGLARQLEAVGAAYYFITLGQNSGHFCAPNATYDRCVGIEPSKCSRRDLVADLYQALHPRGIRLLVYLPAGAPDQDPVAVKALEWQHGPHRNREFQVKWEAVIREWSQRWGDKVAGWWFDGCYWPDEMYRQADAPGFASFAAAARAGNPAGIVAFNPGVKAPIISLSQHEDYTAGEINEPQEVSCTGRWVDGAQFHILSYLGPRWAGSPPRFTDEQVVAWTRDINAHQGVVTWDVPIQADGLVPQPFVDQLAALEAPLGPVVEIEEELYTYEPPDNGSGPLWCKGSTCLVRVGGRLFASGIETLKDAKPLNNVRWLLFERTDDGWALQQRDEKDRTREPCPLAGFHDGRLFLSVNPTLTEPDAYNGPARPQVLQFSAADPKAPCETLLPEWEGAPAFTEHSYRGLAADGANGELLLLNILGHEAQHWSFRDREGRWSARGRLVFPWGADYEEPEAIRLCYPVVALRDRTAYVLAISDIVEPVKAWRAYKRELTGREWDYDFRRLFFTWTPNITTTPFAEWVEIASREKTAGYIDNLDIRLAPNGDAHLLWKERTLDARLREKFCPGERLTQSLQHCVVRDGKVAAQDTLVEGGEGLSGEIPGVARLHATDDGRLFVFYHCSGKDAAGQPVSENRLIEILPGGRHGAPVRVPLEHPFTGFFTATERGGSPPSGTLEVLGQCAGVPLTMRYARIRLPQGGE